MKRGLTFLLIIAMFASVLAGCNREGNIQQEGNNQQSSSAQDSNEYKDTMTLVTSVEATTLDPCHGNTVENSIPMGFIYDTLFSYDAKTSDYIPYLAESWELLDDTHLQINLRKGVKFSNGDPLTTADVYYCFERAKKDPVAISMMNWLDIDNTKVVDDYTIILAMLEPYASVFYALSDGSGRTYIGSKKAIESMGADAFARNPVGTGPYVLTKWETGTSMTFTRNENYWGGLPKTENMVLKVVPEATSRAVEAETGEADCIFYISQSDKARIDSTKGYHAVVGDTVRYFNILLSMQEPLFQNKDVRYALSYALDKEALTKACFAGFGKTLTGLFSPLVEGFKDYGVMPYDIEKAKQLLADAGYPNGFEIDLVVEPTTEFQRIAEAVQAMWAKIGVKANIVPMAYATYAAQKQGKFQASIRDGNSDAVSYVLSIYEISYGNRLQPNDKKLDGMLQELKTIYDKDARLKKLAEIQDYIYDIRFSIPFATVPLIYGVSDKLEGFDFDVPWYLKVKNWQVKK